MKREGNNMELLPGTTSPSWFLYVYQLCCVHVRIIHVGFDCFMFRKDNNLCGKCDVCTIYVLPVPYLD